MGIWQRSTRSAIARTRSVCSSTRAGLITGMSGYRGLAWISRASELAR
jgi:hypothetical protein